MSLTRAQIITVRPDAQYNIPLPDATLSEGATLRIRERRYALGDLVKALVGYKTADLELAFDERGQLEFGQHLYAQLCSELRPDEREQLRKAEAVRVRIITQDEHISRLPWVLLADGGIFLSTTGWSVALSSQTETIDCELSPSPRLLVIAPQPVGVQRTRAESHIENLQNEVFVQDGRLYEGHHLKVVDKWEDFVKQAEQFEPEIVYYYGHGVGGTDRARLVFATGADNKRQDIPIPDFASCLRQMRRAPRLVYVNCCLGDAAGFLGAGVQLEDFVPAVVTNRTVAVIDAAQAQATAFWKSILLKGVAPHEAVAALYGRMGALSLSIADVRWMTPVLHYHYRGWRANPPTPINPLEHDPHWHLKIDRVSQFGVVYTQTLQMLRERIPRSLAFAWYGKEGEGIELFHERLNVQLREELGDTYLYEVRPRWPVELDNIHRSFADMLTEAFEVNELGDIPARIRSKTSGAFGKQTLVYVRHEPVTSSKVMNPGTLKEYLLWWDTTFIPTLESGQFSLLGVSFIVNNPPRFHEHVHEDGLEDLDLDGTVFRFLDEMEKVARRDVLDFLRTHRIRFPIERRDRELDRILEKTEGHYEQTVEELREIVTQVWEEAEGDEHKKAPKKVYDY
ncbi:hypothetical protein HYR99_16735 [Candidatus Poribacteria bacterium]|nr:hypothetical protein [Candidatus Poribacteria bacterium]